jgi:hypothetical protein
VSISRDLFSHCIYDVLSSLLGRITTEAFLCRILICLICRHILLSVPVPFNTDGASTACAHAIQHALFHVFGGQDNILAIPFGQATDSGGGGTGSSFHTELTKLGLVGWNLEENVP